MNVNWFVVFSTFLLTNYIDNPAEFTTTNYVNNRKPNIYICKS